MRALLLLLLLLPTVALARGTLFSARYPGATTGPPPPDPTPPLAGTLFVATTGNDTTGDGSSGNPWATIQKAANTAAPGAVVTVAAGTYTERVTFNTAGTAGNPITFQCAVSRQCFIDGGTTATSGWTQSSGFPTGTFERANAAFGFGGPLPAAVTLGDKSLVFVKPGHTPAFYPPTGGYNYMTIASSSQEWDGIEGACQIVGSVTRCRFRDQADPGTKALKFAPENVATFTVTGSTKGYLTFDGFFWKNGFHCARIDNKAHDVIVKNSTCTNGYEGIRISTGAHHVTLTNNRFTLNWIYANHGLPRYTSPSTNDPTQENIYQALREGMPVSSSVAILDAGTDTTITNNQFDHTGAGGIHIESFQYGADAGYTNANITISDNTMNNCQDYCILMQLTGAPNLQILRNTVHTYYTAFRFGRLFDGKGPMYVGFNTFRNENGCNDCGKGADIEISAYPSLSTPICQSTSCYFYHNTYNSRDSGLLVYSNQDMSRTFWVNNVFSAKKLWVLELIGNATFFSHNWVGGTSNVPGSNPSWWTAPNSRNQGVRIWGDADTGFVLPAGNAAIDFGVNLAASWSAGAAGTQPALPGCASGYFNGSAPDAGAKEK